jgi:hypothetical protein
VGKPGFDLSVAKPLFDLAFEHRTKFTPGYRKNIEEWKATVDQLLTNPSAVAPRADSRFSGVLNPKTPVRRKRSTLLGMSPEGIILTTLFRSSYFDSDESSDDEIAFRGGGISFFQESPLPPFPKDYPFFRLYQPPMFVAQWVEHSSRPIPLKKTFAVTAALMSK